MARLHAAWLRHFCHQRQSELYAPIRSLLLGTESDEVADSPEFLARSEAKGLNRICEKAREHISSIDVALQSGAGERGQESELIRQSTKIIRQAAVLICDINGCAC